MIAFLPFFVNLVVYFNVKNDVFLTNFEFKSAVRLKNFNLKVGSPKFSVVQFQKYKPSPVSL